jgi:hypothetical protein
MRQSSIFPLEKGVLCFTANLRNYLSYYSLKCTENWLQGVLGCLGFFYTPSAETNNVVHGLNGSWHDIFTRLQKQLDTPLSSFSVNCNIHNLLNEIVDSYKIGLIWIDQYELDYSVYYKKTHLWGLVVFLGVEAEHIVIFDNGLRKIPIQIFAKAVSKDGKIIIYYSGTECLIWGKKDKIIVLEGIQATIECLTSVNSVNNEYYGILGMEKFLYDFISCVETERIYNFYYQLNRPSGMTLSRESMVRFCIELKEKWPFLKTESCQMIYEEAKDKWRKIANLLFKLSNTGSEELKKRIIHRFHDVIELEKEGVTSLQVLTQQLKEKLCFEQQV